MKPRCNRRTLKKRIRKALSLTALITVTLLSGFLITISLSLSKSFVTYLSKTVCANIQEEINSGNAARFLGVDSIEDLDYDDPRTQKWIESLDRDAIMNDIFRYEGKINSINLIIEINDEIVYTDEEENTLDLIAEVYEDTWAVQPLTNDNNEEIGSVTVKINEEIILVTLGILIGIILLMSLAALIAVNMINAFLVIPIIKPINQLEKKVHAIANGDQDTVLNTQLVLKRPLREIESLVNSTNTIVGKLHSYNEQLENQNNELEMQNEELQQSKSHIQQQQAQLIQSEKMASVGMLTAAITHEINTPIGAINSNAQLEDMLLGQLKDSPEIQENELLHTIFDQLKEVNDVNLDACRRINEIIRSLKTYSRLDQADFKEADLIDGIKSVLVLTHNLLKRRIVVHENYEDIPPVKCFPGQLNQVFMNIIVNASQAIEGEGDIYIHTYQKDKNICISIKDNGIGIKSEDLSKLFDPGYTTKGVGIGLGLGLYLSYNIIQNHKGDISVISEPGKGAEFVISIPMENETT